MNPENSDSRLAVIRSAVAAGAIAAGLFCLVVSLMMVVNYAQLKTTDPLNLPVMNSLRQQFSRQQSDDALKAQIRSLDLLARKAFFTSQTQLRLGGMLLLGGAGVCVALMVVLGLLRAAQPDPRRLSAPEALWRRRAAVRRGIGVAGGVLLAAALAAWIGADRALTAYWEEHGAVMRTVKPAAQVPPPAAAATGVTVPAREEWLRNWANFRGPGGNAISPATNVPVRWNAMKGEGVKWRVAVPRPGYSSPIVWGQRVFLTAADGAARELYGFDAETGQLLWTTPVGGIPGTPAELPEVAENTGLAAPTPATDGQRVYAIFGTGELLCVDTAGRPVWSRYLGKPDNHYGHASSLLVVDGLLIVQLDDASRPRLLALKTASGETAWESERTAISWASPICVDTGRRKELILCDSAGVEAYDPANGVSLWREDCLGGEAAPSAAYADGMVFAASDTARACGLRLTGTGVERAWEWEEDLPDTASLLASSGRVFMAASSGPIVCLNANDGTVAWQQEFTRACYASPILAEGRVYALDQEGVMHIFEASGTYTAVGTCPLGESAGATPAFVNGRIYIRGQRHLYCIGL